MDAEDAEQEMKLAFLIAVHSIGFVLYAGEITKTAKKQQRFPNYVNMDLQKNMMMLKHYLITKCF